MFGIIIYLCENYKYENGYNLEPLKSVLCFAFNQQNESLRTEPVSSPDDCPYVTFSHFISLYHSDNTGR